MSGKVYCKDCKWIITRSGAWFCGHEKNKVDDPVRGSDIYFGKSETCERRNANCNCGDFERSREVERRAELLAKRPRMNLFQRFWHGMI